MLSLTPMEFFERLATLHPATTPAPSPLSWRPGPECPAACGGDRPRRPPDGGIRAGVEPACPNTRPSGNREITLPVNLFVGDVTRPHLRSLPAAVPPLWGADATDRLRHRQRIDHAHPAYLGEATKAPHIAPAARGPPWKEDFDTREGDTFTSSEPLPEYEFDQRVSW